MGIYPRYAAMQQHFLRNLPEKEVFCPSAARAAQSNQPMVPVYCRGLNNYKYSGSRFLIFWFQIPGSRFLVPDSCFQIPGYRFLVPDS